MTDEGTQRRATRIDAHRAALLASARVPRASPIESRRAGIWALVDDLRTRLLVAGQRLADTADLRDLLRTASTTRNQRPPDPTAYAWSAPAPAPEPWTSSLRAWKRPRGRVLRRSWHSSLRRVFILAARHDIARRAGAGRGEPATSRSSGIRDDPAARWSRPSSVWWRNLDALGEFLRAGREQIMPRRGLEASAGAGRPACAAKRSRARRHQLRRLPAAGAGRRPGPFGQVLNALARAPASGSDAMAYLISLGRPPAAPSRARRPPLRLSRRTGTCSTS